MRAARRPLIVAGGGVHHSGAEDALAAFADATGIPVASTQAGKGSLRHDHPADVGGIGHTGTATADDLARAADLVIGVGTRYTDFTTASGTLFADPAVRFVNLNVAAFDAHKLAALPLVADARAGLDALDRRSSARPPGGPGVRGRATGPARQALGVTWWTPRSPPPTRTPGPPRPRCSARSTRWSATTTSSSTPPDRSPATCTNCGGPARRDQYHVEYGYSCMGYEIPAAIGVRLAAPDRPVWALVGDGTYLMMPTEIVTAVQEGVNINVVHPAEPRVRLHRRAVSETGGASGFGTAYRFRAADGALHRRAAARRPRRQRRQPRPATCCAPPPCANCARRWPPPAPRTGPTCVYVETDPGGDGAPGVPGAQAWWDVPVAATADRPAAVEARARYEQRAAGRRRHL